MDEARASGTQGAKKLDDGTTTKETVADGDAGLDAERLRRLRMKEFLRDLVRQEGRMEAADLLGVDYRTLVKAEGPDEITGRMGDALELLLRRADDAEVARLRESVGVLEGRLAALEGGVVTPDAAEADGDSGDAETGDEDEADAQTQDDKADHTEAQKEGEVTDAEAGRSEAGAAPAVVRLRPANPHTGRPLDPEIVTVEAADDDQKVYGDAWPLIEEWRSLRDGHPNQGSTLSWLTKEERLLVLELAMLEEHGLTLPPEKQPLRGFGRSGQTTHRWKALADTRRALRRRKRLRWVAPWLWREKAPKLSPGPVFRGC